MAGSCMVAIESRKQAASRPRPPLPSPASGSCSSRPSQSSRFSRDDLPRDRVEQQVHDVVRERAADQELHRQVVDALRVLALVGLLGADPPLGQDVAHRARDRLEPLARPGGRDVADAVEEQMALVERIGGARELDGAAAVLREEVRRRRRGASSPLRRTAHAFVGFRGLLASLRRHRASPSTST